MSRLESERKNQPKKAQKEERVSKVVIGPDDTGDEPEPEPSPPQPKPQERTTAKKKRRK